MNATKNGILGGIAIGLLAGRLIPWTDVVRFSLAIALLLVVANHEYVVGWHQRRPLLRFLQMQKGNTSGPTATAANVSSGALAGVFVVGLVVGCAVIALGIFLAPFLH